MTTPHISEVFFNQFEQKCRELIESGFRQMKMDGNCSTNWGEEKLTEELYHYMDELVQTGSYPFMDVDLENNDISSVTGEMGRIDFKVRKATREVNIYTYMECKLMSKDSSHIYEYRKSGLLRFITGKYADRPKYDRGFMVGYVVVEDIDGVIKRLKPRLNSDSDLKVKEPLSEEKIRNIGSSHGLDIEMRILESTHDRQRGLGELTISHIMLDCT